MCNRTAQYETKRKTARIDIEMWIKCARSSALSKDLDETSATNAVADRCWAADRLVSATPRRNAKQHRSRALSLSVPSTIHIAHSRGEHYKHNNNHNNTVHALTHSHREWIAHNSMRRTTTRVSPFTKQRRIRSNYIHIYKVFEF